MDGECFLAFIEQMFAPMLQLGDGVAIDNLPLTPVYNEIGGAA